MNELKEKLNKELSDIKFIYMEVKSEGKKTSRK